MEFLEEIQKRRTFGIISHPDAGKTTLTENKKQNLVPKNDLELLVQVKLKESMRLKATS